MPCRFHRRRSISRTHGITTRKNCLGDSDEINENVELVSSHFGLVANPAAFHVSANRLGQVEGQWQPFRPRAPFARFRA
ncbi:hypothetical protein JI59_15265 [Novosphingobium pentaromativorans US6-1]|nr:hypothetical protein JI59_15265 [Novosphingobium pentaromativorans US6-1]